MHYHVKKATSPTFPIVEVEFEDGTHGMFDFGPYLALPVFKKLNDPFFFSLVKAEHGALSWPSGIDISPERVYEECTPANIVSAPS